MFYTFWICKLVLTLEIITHVLAIPLCPGDDATVEELLEYNVRFSYTYKDISGFLLFVHGINMTVRSLKRMARRLHLSRTFNANPQALQEIVMTILDLHQKGFSNIGYRSMWKLLRIHCGLNVSRNLVQLALKVIDPQGVELRLQRRFRRRQYFNRGPNYAIHIDGYDKLKPFGIAIHGAIDGFSRKILWLEAGPSNKNPLHIANFYIQHLKKLKRCPRLIRSDAGTENVLIRDIHVFLRANHGDINGGTRSYQVGRSVSNQRIESLWSSLKVYFTQFWRNKFLDLRERGIFNDADPLHVECLRFCFLPPIQHHLNVFLELWNCHRIRLQHHELSPSGIPNVLYCQPMIYNCEDHPLPLPTDMDTIEEIVQPYIAKFPHCGCDEDFLEIVHLLTGTRHGQEPIPESYDEAESLFSCIIETCGLIHY